MSTRKIPAPDLTQRAPRSVRVRLGGYALLPRMLDKGRAELIGKNGEYHYNCPLDQHILKFLGVDAEELKAELAKGRTDSQILEWVTANGTNKRTPWEVEQWSAHMENRAPTSDEETRAYFAGVLGKITKTREDILTWADLLDLDDHVSFGGTA
jgi:hypothetical protein